MRSKGEEDKGSSGEKEIEDGGSNKKRVRKQQTVAKVCAAVALLYRKTVKVRRQKKIHYLYYATKEGSIIERDVETSKVRNLGDTSEAHVHGSRKI